jgi:hypothetical protein
MIGQNILALRVQASMADLHIDAINASIGTPAVLSSMSNTSAIFSPFSEFRPLCKTVPLISKQHAIR